MQQVAGGAQHAVGDLACLEEGFEAGDVDAGDEGVVVAEVAVAIDGSWDDCAWVAAASGAGGSSDAVVYGMLWRTWAA